MHPPLHIHPEDTILQTLPFHPYRNRLERRAEQFNPAPDEPQTTEVNTPWGATLTCKAGDYIVNELDSPEDRWVVERGIFHETYLHVAGDRYIKNELTDLVPLTELTGGDPQRMVVVHTLEGPVTVEACCYYLARGVEGEIWPYPKDKADECLARVES